MMKRMVCFGDSNTFGYDAGSRLGRRLDAGERWPEVFAELTGWDTVNEALKRLDVLIGE